MRSEAQPRVRGSRLSCTPAAVPSASRKFRHRWSWWRLAVGGAAAVAVFVFLFTEIRTSRNPARVTGTDVEVKTADGSINRLAEGNLFRANDDVGAVLSLPDASRVEIRPKSELLVEHANDGVRIRLNMGSVIVNAADHRVGHLYVQTKDLTAAVVGTVFLVNVETTGSRVAVIEGEVRVEQGARETKLQRGEQLSTDPLMKSQSVSEEISWSRNADIHLAQLQESRKTIEERCGPTDLRSIVHDNGGWNLRLPGVLWRKYKCQHEGDGQ
jgi:ferric-dicitrate binding protein FerR (iron transport regulator)